MTAPEQRSTRHQAAIDPLLPVAVAAAAIAFLLFAVWRWADANAAVATPLPNAATVALEPVPVPVLSSRRAPAAAERDLSVAAFRAVLEPFAAEVVPRGCIAVAVDGMTVVAGNATTPLIPASNQKLLTAAVALDVLGPEHTFTTELRGAGDGTTISGDVYLIGGGDPVLETAGYSASPEPTLQPTRFDGLAEQLAAAGVTSITGNVVAVDSRYDDERFPPGWSSGIREQEAGPLGALVVDDDIFGGSKPADPALAAAEELVRQLREVGIQVAGAARAPSAPDLPVVASLQSVPLRSIVADVLTNSDDNAAELLLKELGTRVATPGTRENGLSVVRDTLAGWGIDLTGSQLVDGSGLDRSNLASCNEVLGVLVHGASSADYVNALATLGRTGSLTGVLEDHPLAGVLRAKTGTLTDAKALSGYVPVPSGTTIAFSMLLNAPGVDDDYLGTWRRLADALATYPGGPSAAQLAPA